MKAIGKRIKQTDMAPIRIPNRVQSMQDIGKMICSMELGWNSMLTGIDIKECLSRVGEMDRAYTLLQMELYIMANGQMVKLKDREVVNG